MLNLNTVKIYGIKEELKKIIKKSKTKRSLYYNANKFFIKYFGKKGRISPYIINNKKSLEIYSRKDIKELLLLHLYSCLFDERGGLITYMDFSYEMVQFVITENWYPWFDVKNKNGNIPGEYSKEWGGVHHYRWIKNAIRSEKGIEMTTTIKERLRAGEVALYMREKIKNPAERREIKNNIGFTMETFVDVLLYR